MSLTIRLQHVSSGASTAITTIKKSGYATKFHSKPIYHSNPLAPLAFPHKKVQSLSKSRSAAMVRSSLIEPDGGALVDLVVPESQRAAKAAEAEAMPKVRLSKIDVEWVHVVSEGWASPLKGFMREDEYLQTLHFNCVRMEDGTLVNMSLPIVLPIDDEVKAQIGDSTSVALVGTDGDLVAILSRFEIKSFLLVSVLNASKFDNNHVTLGVMVLILTKK